MPELSRFFGIVIYMYYRDHAPGHFHAAYGEAEVTVEIRTGRVHGELPPRVLAHLSEWYALHRDELEANWERSLKREPLVRIEPLE
jgi:hypothetical protein